MFRKVLVANRGEIAVRILRALRQFRIPGVAVYSEADRASLHVRFADEACCIGPAPASESYLSIDRILNAARSCGADAIHPGYGFLSENAEFAEACDTAGLVFIGPPASAIRAMGRKTDARQLARRAGVPTVPGNDEPAASGEEAKRIAESIGYPVLLKAASGGGGKGMRRVGSASELASAFRDASGEALAAFGDGAVYIEKLIDRPRHIEVQIFGDRYGTMVHLGERECSIQRRHQKVIEECPSPLVARHLEMRAAMGEAAVRAARAAGYWNAGTVEFLVDENRDFYFLEMNTRLQVEHPVTEMTTGLDLVELQLRIAAGETLPFRQDDVQWRGSAIECRVYAEDPEQNFLPSPGKITRWAPPSGPYVRMDSGVYPGWTVPTYYDPMLAKLAVWAPTRELAVARLRAALDEFEVAGIRSNLAFFREVLDEQAFLRGELHTGFVPEFFARRAAREPDEALLEAGRLAMAEARRSTNQRRTQAGGGARPSRWLAAGRSESLR